ncbi:MAG TPA: DUF4097 family beta strand repeat-containing protein [Nocardioidaceae bacterium]|nr:DUF4097 family beta strand repeat-containing protein [Nocardioidaceae bacterium]
MSTHHVFDTPEPTSVYVEIGSGDLSVRCDQTIETVVDVAGQDAEDVTVEQRGDQIVVLSPPNRGGFFSRGGDLSVHVTMPAGSRLGTKLGSADVTVTGRLGETMIKTGSGDVSLDAVDDDAMVETGSGDLQIDSVSGDLRTKSGSGDVEIDKVAGSASISTGSGDVEIGEAGGSVQVKSGSGDMRVREAQHDVSLSTASGDLFVDRMHRGRLQAKNVSGDIRVAIPAGIPVWTDVSSMTGSVRSTLDGAGQPEEGQDYIELRAKTVSGDIMLEQL